MQFDDMKAVMVRVLLSSGFYVVQSRIALPPTFGIIQLVESVVNWFSKNIFIKSPFRVNFVKIAQKSVAAHGYVY